MYSLKQRILAFLVAAMTALSLGVSVSATNLADIDRKVAAKEAETEMAENPNEAGTGDETGKSEETGDTAKDDEEVTPSQKIPYFVQPTDYLYRAFNEVMNLYVDRHLYSFTREELLEKFAYDLIKKHPEMYEMFLNTMLGTMDKYSSLHERESGFLSVKSPNAGFGIIMAYENGTLRIEKVLAGSLAESAGLKAGDILRKAMGYDLSGLTLNAVSELLRKDYAYVSTKDADGKYPDYNPPILLTVERDGALLDFMLQKGIVNRDELTQRTLQYREENIGYIRISSFLAETLPTEFESMVRSFRQNGIDKLIIDLRDNGGGSLDLVTKMAELFVDDGDTMCYLNNRSLEQPEAVISTCKDKVSFETISVLVNENTASAAELMASILRNKADAVLVGKTTYGKALGQNVFNFASGDYITITTYEVLDANGESYNETGLVPELALDNVECLYEFPTDLGVFNHENYKTIAAGIYNDACLALEKRLVLLGYLEESRADGIWDDATSLAVRILQTQYADNSPYPGYLDDMTVTRITSLINGYKEYTYYEDSQLDVALIYHSSLSQAKRLIAEKQTLAKREEEKIAENIARREAQADAEDMQQAD